MIIINTRLIDLLEGSVEAFDDFVVGLAVGFSDVAVDMDEGEETVEAEEDEDGVRVVVGHHT